MDGKSGESGHGDGAGAGAGAGAAQGRFVSDYLNLVASRYLGMIVGVVRGILVPRLLDPATYGLYKAFLIIPTYVRAGHLGAVSGLSRQIPFFLGSRDEASLREAVKVAYTFSLGSALASCVLVFAYSWTLEDPTTRVALWIFLVFVVAGQQSKLQETYLLGYQRFVAVSRLNFAQNCYSTAFAVVGAWSYGLVGVVAATALDGVLTLYLFRRVSGIGFPGLSLNRAVIRDLLGVGSPLLLTGLLNNVLFSIDKLLILKFLGATPLGFYSLAATFVLYINDLSNLLSRVLFPRMVMQLGADVPLAQVRRFVHLPITATSYTFPIFVIWIHYFCVWGFRLVFPEYMPGAPVMEILAFSILPYSHFLSHMNLVVAMKRQMQILWIYPVAIGTTGAIALASVRMGWGIEGVAVGAVVGMFLYSILLHFYSERRLLESGDAWPRFWRSYGPTIWVAVVIGADHWAGRGLEPSVAWSLARAGGASMLLAPVLLWGWYRDAELRELVSMGRRFRRT